MIGIRDDVYQSLTNTFNDSENELFSSSYSFYNSLKQNNKPHAQLECHDMTIPHKLELYKHSFLSELVTHSDNFITVTDAIDDLRSHNRKIKPSKYVRKNYKTLNGKNYRQPTTVENHQQRNNSPLVKRRFRLYQVMQEIENGLTKEVKAILKGASNTLSDAAWSAFSRYDYLVENGNYQNFTIKSKFIEFIQNHATKKQTQKALNPKYPAPAALSIPDDACHYHHDELRTLTVREMARIQSFPDNFVFRSKVTTGGQMRKFEVPQYTQVGNAIPPLLGRAIGLTIQNLLNRLE